MFATGPADVLAALPYLLGFHPTRSFCVIPVNGAVAPHVRVDMPGTYPEMLETVESLARVYNRYPGGGVVLISVTSDEEMALALTVATTAILEEQVTVHAALRMDGDQWWSVAGEGSGTVDESTRLRLAAEWALTGQGAPLPSRDALARTLDPVGVDETEAALAEVQAMDDEAAGAWVVERVEQFEADQYRLSAPDAATMLTHLQNHGVRDLVMGRLITAKATVQVALLSDLVRRAPGAYKTEPLALLALAALLRGNSALALIALDQIERPHTLAAILEPLAERGIRPTELESLLRAIA